MLLHYSTTTGAGKLAFPVHTGHGIACGYPRRRVSCSASKSSAAGSHAVAIIGGGLAGISCARALQEKGVDYILIEGQSSLGGRVQTDEVDGFLLDRGFFIYLTSYERCSQLLKPETLDLQRFYAGADVYVDGGFHRVADPFRHLVDALQSLPNPVGSVIDKVLVGLVRAQCVTKSVPEILSEPESTSLEYLKSCGFSPAIIDRFFRPFLGGIFFDNSLTTTSRMTRFVLRQLALGDNCLPAKGIGALATQLADGIPADKLVLGSKVVSVSDPNKDGIRRISLDNGQEVGAKSVVVATTDEDIKSIAGINITDDSKSPPVGTCCLYFKADTLPEPFDKEPILYLNGEGSGIVNNMCFPSRVAPSYAPQGKVLVSVSTVGVSPNLTDTQLEGQVREQLKRWFSQTGGWVDTWQHIRTYRIPYSQPGQAPPTNLQREVDLGDGLFVCGDSRETATFDGAIISGERAAAAILSK